MSGHEVDVPLTRRELQLLIDQIAAKTPPPSLQAEYRELAAKLGAAKRGELS
jgi:hypothetical protein